MAVCQHSCSRRPFVALLFVTLVLTAYAAAQPLAAQESAKEPAATSKLDKIDSALKLIPGDAAFFCSKLRVREQVEAVAHSKAWAKIAQMPVVQQGRSLWQAQADNPHSRPGQLAAMLKNPEFRKILDLLADMGSDEVFFYGDSSFIDFVELVQNVVSAIRYGPPTMQMTGEAEGRNPGQLQATAAISALVENLDLIAVPGLVMGFKLRNADLAKEELIKLEAIANISLQATQQTQGRFKKTQVGGHDYLVLELDGEMIPWDSVPLDRAREAEANEGDVDKIVDRLKESKLVIALGVRDNYLLAAIGSSTDCLEALGGDDRLIDRPEFQPIEKYADKRLTAIGYLSEEINQQINNQEKNIDDLLYFGDTLLTLAKLTEEQEQRIRDDASAFVEDIKSLVPQMGARVGVNFLCDRGIEGYHFAWGTHPLVDGSKPLGLLSHVGGKPILGAVGRRKVSVEDYDRVAKWGKVAFNYFEEFGVPALPEEQRQKIKPFLDEAIPLLKRIDQANREMLIPALADGQLALVVDARLKSKQLVQSLPATEKPMPMPEPALVFGVSDADLLQKACVEYRAAINGLIDAAREVEGSELPEWLKIAEPQVSKTKLGAIYKYPLPEVWGVDKNIAPHFAVVGDVAVVAASQAHVERLLKSTPLAVGGTLAKHDQPLAGAVWCDFAALLEAATPWVDFALGKALASKGVAGDQQKTVVDQVHTGLDVAKALRGVTAECYFEEEVLVTHTLVEIHDVEK